MTIKYRNLDEFLARLEQSRDLMHLSALAELGDKFADKALLSRGDESGQFVAAANLFGTERRTSWALGLERLDELKTRLGFLNDLPVAYRSDGLIGRAGSFLSLIQAVSAGPPRRNAAPVHAQQVDAAAVDLSIFPDLDDDPNQHRMTGLQLVVAETGTTLQSVSLVDVAITGKKTLKVVGGEGHIRSTISSHQVDAALVMGGEPLLTWCAGLPLPDGIDRYLVANWLRGKPLPFVRSVSHQLQVPAETDAVIEGVWDVVENVFTASAITYRDNPVVPMLLPNERHWMNRAYGYFLYPLVAFMIEGIVDLNYQGDVMIVAAAVTDKTHVRRTIFAFWGMERMLHSRVIIVVAGDVDVQNTEAVNRALELHVDWQDDVITVSGDRLIGIDATGF